MASVKQLMAKFAAKPGSNSTPTLSPVSFEEQKKLIRQKELEEIRLAREKAKKYNATLRAKTIQLAKEQSQRNRGLISPRTGSSKAFNFDGASNPSYGYVIGANGSEHGGADKQVDGNATVITEDEAFMTGRGARSEESFEGKAEEKKDVLTEMVGISPRLSRLSQQQLSKVNAVPSPDPMTLPPAEQISTSVRLSGNRLAMKNLSLPSMTDVTIPPPSADRKESDLGSITSTLVIPEGGFEEIHEAVRFNRPSVSDLLLRPTLGERNYSVSSVGPMVDAPEEEPCRLNNGVDIRTVLQTFYQTYAPEKLDDLDLVLRHFKGRSEALLFTLECKYFVSISPDGLVTPYRPSDAPPEADRIEDERQAARRSTMLSTATDMTDFTTDSFKGYVPSEMRDGGLPSTLANSWAVKPKHDSGGARREGRKTAIMMRKAGSDLL